MSSKNLTNYYVWGIKLLLFVIPFLSFWISKSMFFPYITGRNFAFRILVEIALVLWAALVVFNKEYRPKSSPILWAVVAFTAIVGIANFLGFDPYHSFWSRLERMEGYLMILHLAAYFLVLTNVLRTKKEWLSFFNLFVIAGILVGGYGVLQILGIKEAIQGGDVRIDGTIGNPTYLAAYLTLVITLALILFFNSEEKWKKYFYGGAVLFNFFVMFFTASRGAAVALLVSVPLFLILYLILFRGVDSKEKLFKRIALVLLALIILAPISLWLLKDTKLVQNSETLSRFASISLDERTVKSRFQIWGMAWKAFKERPILGWGQENFLVAFSKYYDPRLYDQEPWFDRPHSILFEWLINAGILGLISYLSLFGAFFYSLAAVWRAGAINKKEGLVLIVAPVAYFIQNCFVFDNFNTYVIFFGLLGYINSLYVVRRIPAQVKSADQKDASFSLGALAAGLIAVGALIYYVNMKPIAQAKGIISSLQATTDTEDPVGKTLASFKKTLSYNSFGTAEALEQLARTASLLANQGSIPASAKIPFWEYTITEMEKYLKKFPHNVRIHLMLANIYQGLRNFNPEFIFRAREEIKTALSLSPKKQQIFFLLADNYLATGELNKAIELLETAVNLEPSNREAQTNLGIVAIFTNREDIVKKVMDDLNDMRLTPNKKNPDAPIWYYITDMEKLADAYLQVGKPNGARKIYNKLVALDREVAVFPAHGAYKELLKNLDDRIRE